MWLSFIDNPCEAIQSILQKFSKNLYFDKIHSLIPRPQDHPAFHLEIKEAVNRGTNAVIHKGYITHRGKRTRCIIKIPKTEKYVFGYFFMENLVQIMLYCRYKHRYKNLPLRIPEIFSICMHDNVLVTVMEELNGDVCDYVHKKHRTSQDLFQLLRTLTRGLQVFQEDLQFMHRDLHTSNIMFRRSSSGVNHWYIIDFAMTIFKSHNADFSKRFYKNTNFNAAQDLRTFSVDLYELISRHNIQDNFRSLMMFLEPYVKLVGTYTGQTTNQKYFFHNTYNSTVKIEDPNFLPRNYDHELAKALQTPNYQPRLRALPANTPQHEINKHCKAILVKFKF